MHLLCAVIEFKLSAFKSERMCVAPRVTAGGEERGKLSGAYLTLALEAGSVAY